MTQYCRYCTYMCCGDANYCSVRQKTYSDAHIKRPNKCRDFEFNPIDAIRMNRYGYRPRKPKQIESDQVEGQISMWEVWHDDHV